jgi:hypothetical protein
MTSWSHTKSAFSCVAMRRNRKSVISISAMRSGEEANTGAEDEEEEERGVASEDESTATMGTLQRAQ